jgi:hypothetical protein
VKHKNQAQTQRPDPGAQCLIEPPELSTEDKRTLLDIALCFRYAELMDPLLTEQVALELGEPSLTGWAIRLELTSAEFEVMCDGPQSEICLSFEEHRSGHIALIMSTEMDPLQICLAIPLWEPGIRRWMKDVADTLQITLLLDSVEDDQHAICGLEGFIQADAEQWRAVAKHLKPYRGPGKDYAAMAELGMDVMTGQIGHFDVHEAMQADIRTFVVARRGNALKVMRNYRRLAAELNAELAMARRHWSRYQPSSIQH